MSTIATAKSQHGATNSGSNQWTSSTFPKGYRFRGDASDASLFKAFEEEVITSALARKLTVGRGECWCWWLQIRKGNIGRY